MPQPPSPRTPPSNRPPKGQAKPRKWRQAKQEQQAQKAAKTIRPPGEKSPTQIAQAESRKAARAASKQARLERYRQLEELRTRAVQAGLVEHGLNPIDCLQRLIDDAMIAYILHQQEADAYLTSTPKPDPKLIKQYETQARSLRREAAYFAGLSVQYNLQDRQTKVQEGRLILMVELIQRVLRHPDIDLAPDKIKEVPRLMQQSLRTIRPNEELNS